LSRVDHPHCGVVPQGLLVTTTGVRSRHLIRGARARTDANGYLIEIERGIAPASGQSMRPSELPERVPL
jgi:hypothetical protein